MYLNIETCFWGYNLKKNDALKSPRNVFMNVLGIYVYVCLVGIFTQLHLLSTLCAPSAYLLPHTSTHGGIIVQNVMRCQTAVIPPSIIRWRRLSSLLSSLLSFLLSPPLIPPLILSSLLSSPDIRWNKKIAPHRTGAAQSVFFMLCEPTRKPGFGPLWGAASNCSSAQASSAGYCGANTCVLNMYLFVDFF